MTHPHAIPPADKAAEIIKKTSSIKDAFFVVNEIIEDYHSYRVKYWLTLEAALELAQYWEEVKTEIVKYF